MSSATRSMCWPNARCGAGSSLRSVSITAGATLRSSSVKRRLRSSAGAGARSASTIAAYARRNSSVNRPPSVHAGVLG